jgi:AraC-like DNA-binding protein
LEPALYLPDLKTDQIEETINQYFIEQRPYLKLHYTIQQLAAELNISAQYISAVINRQKKKNFNDFVNEYRIQHCINLLQKGEHKRKTLESIAFQCGFNNRNTFTDAFKKSTGKTPSAYIRELNNSN